MDITLIKLGGSLITDKSTPYKPRLDVIMRLVEEIKKATLENSELRLLLGNGSGSFAHTSAALYGTAGGYTNQKGKYGYCFVQNDAIKINRIVVQEFINKEVPAIGVSPNNIIVTDRQEPTSVYLKTITALLDKNIIPIVYGDVLTDLSNGCSIYSCDKTMSVITKYIPKKYKVVKVISVGDYDGVLDENNHPVDFINTDIYHQLISSGAIKGSEHTDVTGGMRAKLDEMINLAESGVQSIILNGRIEDNLYNCLMGKRYQGTLIKI